VVGAGGVMGGDALQDGLGGTPDDQSVDESVAAAVLEVVGREALPEEAVGVVGEAQVLGEPGAGDGASACGIALEYQLLLDREQRTGSNCLPRLAGVLGRDEVGVRACAALRCKRYGPRPEDAQDAAFGWDRRDACVELVEVACQPA